ncbi:MAG: hypothetical protein ACREX4_21300 [Gammaproteobacteria bacterium]
MRLIKASSRFLLAYLTAAAVGIGPFAADEAISADPPPVIVWSTKPASYELHLQRRHRNALFRPARQQVTSDELARAKARDKKDIEEVTVRFALLSERIIQSPDVVEFPVIASLRKEIEELNMLAITVGGPADDLVPALEALRTSIVESAVRGLRDHPDLRKRLEIAEAAYREARNLAHPILLQTIRKDGPIPLEDLLPRILLEDEDTIRAIVSVMPPSPSMLQEASTMATEALARGYPYDKLKRKLEILRSVTPSK